VHDTDYLVERIGGVPVVTAPAEIDATTADQLRTALLEAAALRPAAIVVDMTHTRFCDSAGLGVLTRAQKRALEDGGEVRVVIPVGGAVDRIFTLTSLYRFMPRFGCLSEALGQGSAPAVRPLRPDPAARLGAGPLDASVEDGESGPVITLSGEADTTSVAQLNALITVQLSGGTRHLTIDVSELSFVDSATIQALVLAAKTLKDRGGTLVLRHPQPTVARVLALTGAEQVFTIAV
jgi:anti-sigma B factor antagonist